MAKFQQDRFEEAAVAYFTRYGLVPTPNNAGTDVLLTKEHCAALAAELTTDKDAGAAKALLDVSTMRDSVARRFIRMAVAPVAERVSRNTACNASLGGGTPRSGKATPLAFCVLPKGHAGKHSRKAK
jgi:hypothetical protein